MAGENDQTKWVGIQPINPPVNIPVTESAPLTWIAVEPKRDSTVFKTATQKRTPAIGDLQAPSGLVRFDETINNVGADPYEHEIYTVPPGKMFMLNYISCMIFQATAVRVFFSLSSGGVEYQWFFGNIAAPFGSLNSFANVLYDAGEIVKIRWLDINATDDVYGQLFGYLMDKYT